MSFTDIFSLVGQIFRTFLPQHRCFWNQRIVVFLAAECLAMALVTYLADRPIIVKEAKSPQLFFCPILKAFSLLWSRADGFFYKHFADFFMYERLLEILKF